MNTPQDSLEHRMASAAERAAAVLEEVGRAYLGSPMIPKVLLTALLARGHALLEGVPGVAKTTLAKAFAHCVHGNFRRIQFTPDLMPADVTGTYVLSPQQGKFELRLGPLFANVVLGDEINRAPAKTQSALLEAMQEGQVTLDGETHLLPQPFIVIATQNPVEQAGTYPLPEAQLDRFLVRILLDYPTIDEERMVLQSYGHGRPSAPAPAQLLTGSDVKILQSMADQVHVEVAVVDYIVRLCAESRHHSKLYLGASPRASLSLMRACKAHALIAGRAFVVPDDVRTMAEHVLPHRLMLSADAQMDGVTTSEIVDELLNRVPERRNP